MEPLFIGAYDLGQHQNLKPFMIPEKAWSDLENAVVYRGRVIRKPGYTMEGRFKRLFENIVLTAAIGGGAFSGNLITIAGITEANAGIAPGTVSVTTAGYTFEDINRDGQLICTVGAGWYMTITSIAQGTSTVITVDSNIAQIGDTIFIQNVGGMTELNSQQDGVITYYTVTASTVGVGGNFTIDVDSTNFAAYTSGGTAQQNRGTVNYSTGALQLTLNASFNGLALTGTFYYFPNLPVMGLLTREQPSISVEQTIGFDTTYAYKYSAGGWSEFIPGTTWSGSLANANNNFFWGLSYWRVSSTTILFWVTNFSIEGTSGDPIRYTDGSMWTPFAPIVQADAADDAHATKLLSCLMLIPYKGRLLAFNTWEGSRIVNDPIDPSFTQPQQFKNRVRWSQNGDPTVIGTLSAPNTWGTQGAWASDIIGRGGYFDAPTGEAIVSAGFVKDQLIVYFERSSWQLLYTGNEILPFIWQRINAELGAEATFSNIRFDNGLVCFGNVGIHACNGQSTERIDGDIPDLVFNSSNVIPLGETNSNVKRVYGIRDFQRELVYWTFVTDATEGSPQIFPDRVLCYNYRNNTFSEFDDHFTCFGYFYPSGVAWDDLPYASWNDWDLPWDSGATQQEQQVIAGNQQGFTFGFTGGSVQGMGKISNDQSIYIKSVSGNTITSPNHNLDLNSYVLINNMAGSLNRNGTVALVTATTQNTFIIDGDAFDSGYLGGGTCQPVANINIQTKQFPPFWNTGQRYRLTKARYLFDRTSSGEVACDVYTSMDSTTSMSNPVQLGNTGLLGTGTVSTAPNPDLGFQELQGQIWQSQYTWVEGDTFQIAFTFNDDQMRNMEINTQDVQLHGMVLYFEPSGEFR